MAATALALVLASLTLLPAEGERAAAAPGEPLPAGATLRLGSRRLLHTASANAVAFSPDGALLYSAGSDRLIRAWDVTTGLPRGVRSAHTEAILALAVSADGSVISTGMDGSALRFGADLEPKGSLAASGERFGVPGPDGSCAALFGREPSKVLVFGSDGKIARTIDSTGEKVVQVVFSRDGKRLAISGWQRRDGGRLLDGVVLVTGVAGDEGKVRAVLEGVVSHALGFAPDGRSLWIGGVDGKLRSLDFATGALSAPIAVQPFGVTTLAVSGNGSLLATGSEDGKVTLLDGPTGQAMFAVQAHTGAIQDLTFSPAGDRIASCATDGSVRILDGETGQPVTPLSGNQSPIECAAMSLNGAYVATGGGDGTVVLWSAETGEQLATLLAHKGFVNAMHFSPFDGTLVTCGHDGYVRIFDPATATALREIQISTEVAVLDVALAPGGKRAVVACGDGIARVVELSDGTIAGSIQTQKGVLAAVACSPDGELLATGTSTIQLWNAATFEAIRDLEAPRCPVGALEFLPGGTRLAAACADLKVRIFDLAKPEAAPLAIGGFSGRVDDLALSLDGSIVSAGESTGTDVVLADTTSGAELARYKGHEDAVRAVFFSADGRSVWSASADRTALRWPVPNQGKGK